MFRFMSLYTVQPYPRGGRGRGPPHPGNPQYTDTPPASGGTLYPSILSISSSASRSSRSASLIRTSDTFRPSERVTVRTTPPMGTERPLKHLYTRYTRCRKKPQSTSYTGRVSRRYNRIAHTATNAESAPMRAAKAGTHIVAGMDDTRRLRAVLVAFKRDHADRTDLRSESIMLHR